MAWLRSSDRTTRVQETGRRHRFTPPTGTPQAHLFETKTRDWGDTQTRRLERRIHACAIAAQPKGAGPRLLLNACAGAGPELAPGRVDTGTPRCPRLPRHGADSRARGSAREAPRPLLRMVQCRMVAVACGIYAGLNRQDAELDCGNSAPGVAGVGVGRATCAGGERAIVAPGPDGNGGWNERSPVGRGAEAGGPKRALRAGQKNGGTGAQGKADLAGRKPTSLLLKSGAW